MAFCNGCYDKQREIDELKVKIKDMEKKLQEGCSSNKVLKKK